ncbi:hypothetical protein NHP200010_05130 [Helicobacter bizzozeronii]|uniref:hypothetical protein n=1 Tax=Helicobacter bizzozeronii TaxID=56877 RepID=UPI00244D95D7|nr:hypothetical protein [Helicobacter bizzozeronii]GMB92802.1 hypothetical protein NHP200010_05130 [Helicobacter bizzozeronii]
MKKLVTIGLGLVFLGFFIGGLAFERFILGKHASKKDKTQITLEIQTTQEVTPKTYTTHLVFSSANALLSAPVLSSQQEESIKEGFLEINKLVKNSNLCHATSYSLKPNYTFDKDNRQVLTGYKLYADMGCSFKASALSQYETLRDKIAQVAAKSTLFVLNTPALHFKTEDLDWASLQGALVQKAQEQANFWQKKLNKQCHIQHLDLYGNNPTTRLSTLPTQNKEPSWGKLELFLIARLVLECV